MHLTVFLIGMLGCAAITDLVMRKIPNALVAAGLVSALMLHVFLPDAGGWKTWLLGMLTGFAMFLPFYLLRGMAAGDVKLMAAVGAFVGPLMAFKIALATFVIGGVWALAVVLLRRRIRDAWNNLHALVLPLLMRTGGMPAQTGGMPHESVGRLPYGVAIALGTVAALLWERG